MNIEINPDKPNELRVPAIGGYRALAVCATPDIALRVRAALRNMPDAEEAVRYSLKVLENLKRDRPMDWLDDPTLEIARKKLAIARAEMDGLI